MKTRHIIAIGLLTATAVGLLAFGINKSKYKPKTMVKADDNIITIFTDNGTINRGQYTADSGEKFYINGTWATTYTKNTTQNSYNVNIHLQFTLESVNIQPIYVYSALSNHPPLELNFNKSVGLLEDSFGIGLDFNSILFSSATKINTTMEYYIDEVEGTTGVNSSIYAVQNNIAPTMLNLNNAFRVNNYFTTLFEVTGHYSTEFLEYLAYEQGYTDGYNAGYGIGYNDSEAFNHPIDLMPTMLNILTMPFTFISQAFDVTLWPGTQYQINIGNFIKAIIAISAILFIIKLFTTGFSIIGNYTNNYQNNQLTKEKRKLVKAQTNLANRTDPNRKTIKKE